MAKPLAAIVVLSSLMVSASPTAGGQSAAAEVPEDPSAVGYLNLHKRHPDGPDGRDDFRAHGVDEALGRLEQIRGFLSSFARLTTLVRGQLDDAGMGAIGNTGRDLQTIGFHNLPLIVEGTILKQEYQLKQARYELAQLRYERQQVGAETLAQATAAYRDATERLQRF